MTSVEIQANAKINIGLRIIGKLPNGYHEIETIFQEIDLHDTIKLEPIDSQQIIIETNNLALPYGDENICFKAVRKIENVLDRSLGVKINIKKRIPVGAGLGGGSSDAAAVIVGLDKLFSLNLDDETKFEIARDLGADVPFFLHGGTMLATGIGDKLEPIEMPFSFFGVLVYPNFPISTAWAYKNCKFNLTKTKKIIKLACFQKEKVVARQFFQNDFEKIVFKKYPELRKLKDFFYRKGAFLSLMSGSGSSIFGLFREESVAKQVKEQLASRYQSFLIQPLKRHL